MYISYVQGQKRKKETSKRRVLLKDDIWTHNEETKGKDGEGEVVKASIDTIVVRRGSEM